MSINSGKLCQDNKCRAVVPWFWELGSLFLVRVPAEYNSALLFLKHNDEPELRPTDFATSPFFRPLLHYWRLLTVDCPPEQYRSVRAGRLFPASCHCSLNLLQLLAPDETVVTLIQTGSSGVCSLFTVFSTIMLPLPVRQAGLRGNCSGDLFLRTAYCISRKLAYSCLLAFHIHPTLYPSDRLKAVGRSSFFIISYSLPKPVTCNS